MKALLAILITIMTTATSQAQTAEQIKIKRIKAEGRAARYSFNVYKKKVDMYQAKIDNKTQDIEEKKEALKNLYIKAKCRLKEHCDHNRKLKCSKYKRTLGADKVNIEKSEKLLEKYKKQHRTNKKFMDKKKAYIEELINMLKGE